MCASTKRAQDVTKDVCADPCAKNDVIPLRSKTNPLLFGPADAAATEEPAPPSLSGHDYSLDFRNIRATRARNTVKVTIADLFLAVTRRTETSHPVPLSTVFSRSAR
ncbi:unnamed protein product [Pleuronectes platessa]|uniref:Uncharacterized protein n=1 Tax=Pleuronectes platessa TaxID=8262 RepID=A0A9N7V0M0_PLEPL|nr:unnamed protein product [Pleuronectes platessa]